MSKSSNQAKQNRQGKKGGKYLGLITLVVLFLLLTVGMLAGNTFIIRKLSDQSQVLALTTQQGQLSQQLSKAVLDINLYLDDLAHEVEAREGMRHENSSGHTEAHGTTVLKVDELPQDAFYVIEDIRNVRNSFEANLTALEKGGTIELNGQQVEIEPLTTGTTELQRMRSIWTPYLGLLDRFLTEVESGTTQRQSSDFLVDYARLYGEVLLNDTDKINALVNQQINRQSSQWNWVQAGGILAAFILFALIVFGALRQLVKNDKRLNVANQEMSEIMSSVNEGLFLLDRNLIIAGQYSGKLEDILGQKNLAERSFLNVLEGMVSQEELDTTKVFVDQLYSEWVVGELVEDLNPLHRICVNYEANGVPTSKYLDFRFFRVYVDDKIERILVSVSDTTETVRMQASLEMQKEQEERELEMLNTILNANPVVMANFIRDSIGRLDEVNHALKNPSTDQKELRNRVQYIARLIHSVKGEASSMKLNRMVSICENFEEMIGHMKRVQLLSGQDFLALVVLLEDLYRLFDILENYAARVGGGNVTTQANLGGMNQDDTAQSLEGYLKQFVSDIAQRTGKQARLNCRGLNEVKLNDKQQSALKDIAIQLLRNAVIHGIETPDVRAQRNKAAMGNLTLNISQENGQILLDIEDDGNGIDFEAIRAKAVRQNLVSAEDAPNLDRRRLLALMFSSGFSTAAEQTEDAGRGVGMDIVKTTIQELGGKINVSSQAETHTRFSFTFPQA